MFKGPPSDHNYVVLLWILYIFAANHLLLTHEYDEVGNRADVLHCFNYDTYYDHQSHLMRSLLTIHSSVLRPLDFSRHIYRASVIGPLHVSLLEYLSFHFTPTPLFPMDDFWKIV